jgi:hypothetical protein
VSPSGLAIPLKFLLSGVLLTALVTYLTRVGLPQPETT